MYSNQRKNNPMMVSGKSASRWSIAIFIMVIIGFVLSVAG